MTVQFAARMSAFAMTLFVVVVTWSQTLAIPAATAFGA